MNTTADDTTMPLFLFDMDEVLYRYDWHQRMSDMTALTGLDIDELRRRWWNPNGGERLAEAGYWPDPESYLSALNIALGCELREEDWARARGAAMTPIPRALEAVRLAASAGRVGLLTNNGPLAHRWIPTWAPDLAELFGEHLTTTSVFGARKPDPEVYRRAIEHHGAVAERTFFADDQRPNIDSALTLGIHAVHVVPETDLVDAVAEFITTVTPDSPLTASTSSAPRRN